MRNSASFRNRSAFTLVELLVVIGIITVLISLLLPALNKARASAQALVCLSNLRQVGMGIATYASESRGYTPPSSNISSGVAWGNSFGSGWVSRLAAGKYVGTTLSANLAKRDVFACPLDNDTLTFSTASVPYYSSYKGLAHFWTANLPGGPTGPSNTMFNNSTPLKLTQLRVPAMERMPWHNGQLYRNGNPPSRFPLITENHLSGGMTRDPWGFNHPTSFFQVPHPRMERGSLMNDLSVERIPLGF